jgi:hypothetical protein
MYNHIYLGLDDSYSQMYPIDVLKPHPLPPRSKALQLSPNQMLAMEMAMAISGTKITKIAKTRNQWKFFVDYVQ